MWIDYDKEADVLYISFKKPQQANDSVMEEDIILPFTVIKNSLASLYCMRKAEI